MNEIIHIIFYGYKEYDTTLLFSWFWAIVINVCLYILIYIFLVR